MKSQNTIVVGIVVFNTPAQTLHNTLKHILASTLPVTLVVLCNSQDISYQKTVESECQTHGDKIHLIFSNSNKGFGAAHNIIWQKFPCCWYICCNPDVMVEPTAIEELITFGEIHQDVSLLMPKVLNPDGTLQHLARKHPSFGLWCMRQFSRVFPRLFRPFEVTFDYTRVQNVEFVSGCFFAVRFRLLQELKGFDERYFLYAEDADLSRRATPFGPNMFIPQAVVTHEWCHASQSQLKFFFLHLKSIILYWRIHGLLHPTPPSLPVKKNVSCSVAMCTFNGESFLEEQLSSIVCQLQPQDEILVGDDHSSDKTLSILHKWASQDSRIKILSNQPNRLGIVKNFERVVGHCKGDIILLCDQDDIWKPNKLETVITTFKNNPHASLLVSDADTIDGQGRLISKSFLATTKRHRFTFISCIIKNSFLGSAMAFRPDIVSLALPFPPRVPMHDWWIGMVAIVFRKKTLFLNESLILYRRHSRNASPSKRRHLWAVVKDRVNLLNLVILKRVFFPLKGGQ